MAALSKIAKEGVESLTDFLKSFSDKTYYHGSNVPDIKKFDSGKESTQGGVDNTGATYFTSDENYAHEYALGEFIDDNFKRKINDPFGNIRDYVVKGPMAKSDAEKIYQGTNFTDLTEYGRAPTVYPVKIKTNNLFDFENTEQVDDLISSFGKYWDREFGENTEYLIREGDWSTLEIPEIQSSLKDLGFRGYKTNEPGTVGLFYPDQGDVRSINAKFDPAKAKSGNILASVPAAAAIGLSGYGALDALGEENGQSID